MNEQPKFTDAQIKSAFNANALGFCTQVLASGTAKTKEEAQAMLKRATVIFNKIQEKRAPIQQLIVAQYAAPAS